MDEAGSTANLSPGEIMSLQDLLYCAMVESANEACNIIGEYIAGSLSAFVERMNARAQELGCSGTHFAIILFFKVNWRTVLYVSLFKISGICRLF